MNAKPLPFSLRCGPSEYFRPSAARCLAEFGEAVHLEGQMCQVRLDLHRSAGRVMTDFNQFLTFGRFEKGQLGTARRFVATDFLQAQDS